MPLPLSTLFRIQVQEPCHTSTSTQTEVHSQGVDKPQAVMIRGRHDLGASTEFN